ncbi:MAG: hypothetical protein AAFX54_09415 [Pseudomonadota bacterium]
MAGDSDRLARYSQLFRIAEKLGDFGCYAGRAALGLWRVLVCSWSNASFKRKPFLMTC